MKWILRIIFFVGLCASTTTGNTQSIQAMVEQIAALRAYIATAEKGYQIAEEGIHEIKDIKNGEFNLHSTYINSLTTVNPTVKDMPEVTEIFSLEAAILKQFSDALNGFRQSKILNTAELDYIEKVYARLITLGTEDVNGLQSLITDGSLQMEDGERIRRIEAIDQDMRGQYRFVQEFIWRAAVLAGQRKKEIEGIDAIKGFYGLP